MLGKLGLWALLLAAGFLTGYILQYAALQRVQRELNDSSKQLQACRIADQSSQLRDTGALMYLEAVQKNYGKAGEYSKSFFDQAQQIVNSTDDAALRNSLRDTLATRDQITADLAKGDGVALSEILPVLYRLEQSAKH